MLTCGKCGKEEADDTKVGQSCSNFWCYGGIFSHKIGLEEDWVDCAIDASPPASYAAAAARPAAHLSPPLAGGSLNRNDEINLRPARPCWNCLKNTTEFTFSILEGNKKSRPDPDKNAVCCARCLARHKMGFPREFPLLRYNH
jgi:hypothetical protein